MAQKVTVELVDDMDGTAGDDVTTVQFGLDGVMYEIDLTSTNAEKLRGLFADYIDSGRRTGGRIRRGGIRLASIKGGVDNSAYDPAAVRQWADVVGEAIAPRGRIPATWSPSSVPRWTTRSRLPSRLPEGRPARRLAASPAGRHERRRPSRRHSVADGTASPSGSTFQTHLARGDYQWGRRSHPNRVWDVWMRSAAPVVPPVRSPLGGFSEVTSRINAHRHWRRLLRLWRARHVRP
jgi:hypothetical protein